MQDTVTLVNYEHTCGQQMKAWGRSRTRPPPSARAIDLLWLRRDGHVRSRVHGGRSWLVTRRGWTGFISAVP